MGGTARLEPRRRLGSLLTPAPPPILPPHTLGNVTERYIEMKPHSKRVTGRHVRGDTRPSRFLRAWGRAAPQPVGRTRGLAPLLAPRPLRTRTSRGGSQKRHVLPAGAGRATNHRAAATWVTQGWTSRTHPSRSHQPVPGTGQPDAALPWQLGVCRQPPALRGDINLRGGKETSVLLPLQLTLRQQRAVR